jgi:general secretion pathway protein J
MTGHRRLRGLALIEMLIAIAILAMISMLIYGAFAGMKRSKEGIERINDRYREGRLAMARLARELSSAYLSAHVPINEQIAVQKTLFVGKRGTPADRIDFTAFSHHRLDRDSKESDQAEISYFGSQDPDKSDVTDLARRVSPRIDLDPQRGGRVDVLATDIDLFNLEYLDPLTGQWVETWDTTQATGQAGRLPLQVRILLVLNGGRRAAEDRSLQTIRLVSKVIIPIQNPLTFALQ